MKRRLSLFLTIVMMLSLITVSAFSVQANAQESMPKTLSTTEFVHLTYVPDGYVGIYTKSDLDGIRNNLNGNYILMNDIEFSDEDFSEEGQFYNDSDAWNPIGSETDFSGTFDGNGYSIINIKLSPWLENEPYIGLFAKLSGTIKNLNISGIMNVTQKIPTAYIGALAGYSDGTILNCSTSFDITISAALVQTNNLAIYAGGIVGYSGGSIDGCSNNGKITITERLESFTTSNSYFGGICGYAKSTIANCENKSEITVNCTGNVSCAVGGICGKIDGCLSNNTNYADVNAIGGSLNIAGGIVGVSQASSKVTSSSNNGNISCGASEETCYAAGVVSYNAGEVSRCSNNGEVLTKVADYQYSGGICAYSKGIINECYNTGAVLWTSSAGFDKYTGGIVSVLNSGTVTNCYNAGHVSENMWTGEGEGAGIAGNTNSSATISNCYNVGASGQCAGIKTGAAQTSNCYYLEYSALGDVSGALCGISCTTNQMSQKETFIGFDFETIWSIDPNSSYKFPTLKNNIPKTNQSNNFEEFAGGNGSFENPYLISNVTHLKNIVNYPHGFFRLINDIDMSNQSWVSNDFMGVLDGDGHHIYNLRKSLFNDNEGCIVNLHLRDANINGSGFVGRYCFGKVLNCSFSGNAVYGGIVYEVLGSVANCVNYGTITGSTAGGITRYVNNHSGDAGTWHGFVINCANYGTIKGTTVAGGIASTNLNDTVTITNCYNAGAVYSDQYAGGIFGKGSVSLVNCYNVGLIEGTAASTGALIGYTTTGYAENCYYLDNMSEACPNEIITATVLSSTSMEKKSSFRRFDFDTVWTIDGDLHYLYPELRTVPIDCNETIEYAHNFTRDLTTYLKSEATCTSSAVYYECCAICGEKGTGTFEYGAKKEHSFTKKVITDVYKDTNATCTNAAIYYYCCTTCDTKGSNTYKVGDALGHTNATAVVENEVKATCTADGIYDSVVYCSVCKAELSREVKTIEKLGHDHSTEWTEDVAPTCTTAGSKSHHCTRCDDKVDVTVVPENGHFYGDWYVIISPTCTTIGTDEHKCSVCQHSETRTVDALGHTNAIAVVENKVDATCTADGSYDSVVYCSVCNTELSREVKTIEKLGHDYNTTWSTDASSHWHECSKCGDKKDNASHTAGAAATEYTAQTCTVCGYVITPALGHTHHYSTTWSKDADNHWYDCTGCSTHKDKATHDYTNACDTDCNTCGYVREITHAYKTEWSKDAEKHWYECSACGDKINETIHTPGADATETADQTCTVCGYVIREALGHTHNHNTMKNDETNHWNECACGDKTGITAHTWDDGVVTKEATYDEEGEKTFTCSTCSKTKIESVEKLVREDDTNTDTEVGTDVPADTDKDTDKTEQPSGGCRSAIGIGAGSIVAIAMICGAVIFVKKRKST